MPTGHQEQEQWGVAANCYAYAYSCPQPVNGANGGAIPGMAAGEPAFPGDPGYRERLIQGALADGRGQVAQVSGAPSAPPADTPGTYLVALMNNAVGFHWLRRDPTTLQWSWKDGNGSTVKLNILDASEDAWVFLTDTNLNALFTNPGNFFPWNYGSMAFVSFFRVPLAGIAVSGRPT